MVRCKVKWRPMEDFSGPKNSLCVRERERERNRGLNQQQQQQFLSLNVCLLFFLSEFLTIDHIFLPLQSRISLSLSLSLSISFYSFVI